MIVTGSVTIILNGSILSSVAPAQIIAGRVVAPLTPIVVRLATRVAYAPGGATVVIERDGIQIVVPIVRLENDVPSVELGSVVRRFGGSAVFDPQTKTLAIVFSTASTIVTPPPYDPGVLPLPPATFAPVPSPRTARSAGTSVPRPRRTAIPAAPSEPQPLVPVPSAAPTAPRH